MREYSGCRTYVPEPKRKQERVWTDKPREQREAVYANRRRTRGQRGRNLQRLRSERVERSFAHVCETGGARRTWLRGIEKVKKRYLISAVAHNLGVLMRALFGIGTPRGLQTFNQGLEGLVLSFYFAWLNILRALFARRFVLAPSPRAVSNQPNIIRTSDERRNYNFSTGW